MASHNSRFHESLLHWQEQLDPDFDAVKYSPLLLQPCSVSVRHQVDRALAFIGQPAAHEVLGDDPGIVVQGSVEDSQMPPHRLSIMQREALRRNLLALSIWNRRLGHNRSFATFCKAVIALPISERQAFQLSVALYQRFDLDDYYVKDNGWLEQDIMDVVRVVESLWPSLVGSFQAHGCRSRLCKLIESLLTTLLAEGFSDPNKVLSEFLPLLHRLVLGSESLQVCSMDRRWALRHLVVCCLGRNRSKFESAGSQEALMEACEGLRKNMRVDTALLELVDGLIGVERCAQSFGAMTTFFGMAAGWTAGQKIGTVAAALASSTGASASLGVIGAAVGAISVAFSLGSISAARLAREAANELVTDHDLDGDLLALEGSWQEEPLIQDEDLTSTAASTADVEDVSSSGRPSEDEEVADDEDLPMAWFFWGKETGHEEELRRVLEECEQMRHPAHTHGSPDNNAELMSTHASFGQVEEDEEIADEEDLPLDWFLWSKDTVRQQELRSRLEQREQMEQLIHPWPCSQ